MSTRTRVALALPRGRYKSIYSHHAGHPAGLGKTLVSHYRSAARAAALIELGNVSQVRAQLDPPEGQRHWFEQPLPDVTAAYPRDRGDYGTHETSDYLVALMAGAMQAAADYFCVFHKGRWAFTEVPRIKSARMPGCGDNVAEVAS